MSHSQPLEVNEAEDDEDRNISSAHTHQKTSVVADILGLTFDYSDYLDSKI